MLKRAVEVFDIFCLGTGITMMGLSYVYVFMAPASAFETFVVGALLAIIGNQQKK